MQLFTFGHPCEHQLRRVCIGGTSCPLNGYPDHWCCSFVKGRINFKRDKPCEGARCRWGFAHPPNSSFDAVSLVLQEGRACAAKMEEGYGTGTMHGGPYIITSPHVADVAHCALNMLRVPAARIATRVGGMLAFAAVKSNDAKIFTQLLKTMKKPVDEYLIGAFEFIQSAKGAKGKGGDSVLDDLRQDVTSIMGSALCSQGTLIARPEQLPLQSYYIVALKTATRNKKKFAESLDQAAALFPEAVEAGLVPPESFVRAGRKDANGSSTASEVEVVSAGPPTPDHKPASAPSQASTPIKAASAATPPLSTVPPTTSAAAVAETKQPTPTKPAAPAAAPQKAVTSAPTEAPKVAPAGVIQPPNKVTPEKTYPTLFNACQALPVEHAFSDCFSGCWHDEPPSALHILGGLFSLDTRRRGDTSSTSSTDVSSAIRPAPLGAAIRDAHAASLVWMEPLTSVMFATNEADRLSELQAAAAALSAADAVLE